MKNLLIFDFSDTLVNSKTEKIIISRKRLLELKKKGYLLALFTAEKRKIIDPYLSGIYREAFDLSITLEDVTKSKPSPEGVIRTIKSLKPSKTIYIGDSENDFKAALSAKVSFLTPDLIYLL